MAYPISKEVLDLFKGRYRQIVEISFYGAEETLHLTESDIVQGGMTIDRYCVSGSSLEIGSAIASELTLVLNNKDGRFNNVVFEGAELFVRIGIKKWDAHKWEKAVVHYIPMGYFTVDNSPRKLTSISLSALDRMAQFDKIADASKIAFPITISGLLDRICSICNVALATKSSTLTNGSYKVKCFPNSEGITYRQILMWIAEITGTCAYIDWEGKLKLKWYDSRSSESITPSERYSSDLYEKAITIRGVKATDTSGKEYTADISNTDEYAFNIESNELIQSDAQPVVNNLAKKFGGFTYTPYTCTTKPLVHLYPLDSITYVDKNGTKIDTVVTNVTYNFNGNMMIAAQGESATNSGYASANPLTKQQATIISNIIKQFDADITERENAIVKLNEMIANSLGLYQTSVEQSNGSVKYYFHNEVSLENSTVIYTFNEGGFAWSDKWNGDATVWQYGFTRDGNAVLNILSAYKIQAEQIETGSINAGHLSVEYTEELAGDLDKRDAELTQKFKADDGLLKSDITNEYKNAVSDAKESLQTQIEQNAEKIKLTALSIADIEGTVLECQSQIDVAAIRIESVVSRTYGATVTGSGFPADNTDKDCLYHDTDANVYYHYNIISEAWEKIEGNSIQSAFIQTADGFSLSGIVSISGDLITDGTISSERIDTNNLSCTALYAKDNPDGYSVRLNGGLGDFGIFNPNASDVGYANSSDCMFGIYNSIGSVSFCSYGNSFLTYVTDGARRIAKPQGTWDFSECDSNLTARAVFG